VILLARSIAGGASVGRAWSQEMVDMGSTDEDLDGDGGSSMEVGAIVEIEVIVEDPVF
jgi:hypothetical protein